MESEDDYESDPDAWKFSRPWMRLFEDEENVEIDLARTEQKQSKITSAEGSLPMYDPRFWIVLRFFRTVQGFHQGSLDLTGRHRARYEKLWARWTSFSNDLLEVVRQATRHEYEEDHWFDPAKKYTVVDYIIPDTADVWQNLQKRWGLGRSRRVNLSFLIDQYVCILRDLSKHPTPKFQEVVLLSLPYEILEIIMAECSIEKARLLSATCQYLRRIGLRFIFHSRTLVLDTGRDWSRLLPNEDEDRQHHQNRLCIAARASKATFMERTDFLLSRPDLMSSMQHLDIIDQWSEQTLHRAVTYRGFDVRRDVPKYYESINLNIARVLRNSINLTALDFHGLTIRSHFLLPIVTMKSLVSVTFSLCRLKPSAARNLAAIQSKSSTVLNLNLRSGEPWNLLLLFAQLRNLTASGDSYDSLDPPSEAIREHCNLFSNLERVCLHRFNPEHVVTLCEWMTQAASIGPGSTTSPMLKITHFKLHTARGTPDSSIIQLLGVLQFCPDLVTLVLDGLRDAELALIDHIGQACPNILGLTLIRRHNDRQTESRTFALWPYTSGQYGSRFGVFTRLRYFGWNPRIDSPHATPSIMQQFEVGFPDLDTSQGWEMMREQETDFWDDHLMAGPFGAFCSTLQTVSLGIRSSSMCMIERTLEGYPVVKQDPDYNQRHRILSKWNPDWPYESWPNVAPLQRAE